MEKRKKIEGAIESLLPKEIIQHIQSFLTGKEAAQTTILSKSWYTAWLTRPNLDFDQSDCGSLLAIPGDEEGFWEFSLKTMLRYEVSNLKIESLRLAMRGVYSYMAYDRYSCANDLIVKAMKMGATDLSFQQKSGIRAFTLPFEVLESETLVKLSLHGCKIKQAADGKVSCSRLKSLNFESVYIEGDLIWDIISCCPLIEELSLSECLILSESYPSNLLELSPFVEFGRRNVGLVVDSPIKLFEFHKLNSLLLTDVIIHTLFFRDFSSKFPCLKNLSINNCVGFNYKGIRICSHSLECISFTHKKMLRVWFDVPRIRKFKFCGLSSPCLTFQTIHSEWESDICLRSQRPSTNWFVKLHKLLFILRSRLSKISLSVATSSFVERSVDFQCLPKISPNVVDYLTIQKLPMYMSSSDCSALLKCLFWSCRPKLITLCWPPKSYGADNAYNYFLETLYEKLQQGTGENCSNQDQGMIDLKEVNGELFEDGFVEWLPLPSKTLLNDLKSRGDNRKTRFQLRWGQSLLR